MRIAMQKKQFHSVVTLYQLNEIKRKNLYQRSSKEEHKVDALALRADEGRDKLR